MKLIKQQRSFLIYAHEDRGIVRNLYKCMVKDGVVAWMDEKELLPGQNWKYEICKAIGRSDIVMVCISRQFNRQGGYRKEELKLALKRANLLPAGKIFIIPVRLEKCNLPESLGYLHRVDLFEAGGYKRLVRALRRLA